VDEQDPTPPGAGKQPGGPVDNAPDQPGEEVVRAESTALPEDDPPPQQPTSAEAIAPQFPGQVIPPEDLEIIEDPLPEAAEPVASIEPEPETPTESKPSVAAEPVATEETPFEEPADKPATAEVEPESEAPPEIEALAAPPAPIEAPEPETPAEIEYEAEAQAASPIAEPEAQTPAEIEPPVEDEAANTLAGLEVEATATTPEPVAEAESEPAIESEPEIEAVAESLIEPDADRERAPEGEPEVEAVSESLVEPEAALEAEPEPVTAEEIFEPEAVAEEESAAPEPVEEPEAIAAFEASPPADAALFETDELGRTVFDTGEDDEEAPAAQAALNEAPDAEAEIIPPPVIVEPPPRQHAEAELDAALMRPAPPAEPPRPAVTRQIAAAISALMVQLVTRLKKRGDGETPAEPRPAQAPAHKGFVFPRLHKPNFRRIIIIAGWMTAGVVVIIAAFFIYLTKDMPSTKSLWTADNSPSLTFIDRHNRVIIREGAESAPPVDLSRLPPYVTQAVLAIEDRRFYDHFGIDVGGLMRATLTNFRAGHVVQGGSTITQQLAKNLFLSNSRTVKRKLQEVALALWLESQFSKRDILALYMSRVYFGAGAYGIEAASERYFDKPAKNLSLAEAALLAGLVKAPSKLNPAAQDAAAKARAKIVLDEMLSAGFITATQHASALQSPLAISRNNPSGNLGYFRDWIDPQLFAIVGDQRDDFIVETTLDLDAQRAGEVALKTVIDRERKLRNVSQGAVLAMDSTGGVTTMVGGLNYGKAEGQSEFNRTTQSLRAPGSSFKYFIYMTAMEQGITPWAVRVDRPVVIGDWAPGNYEDKYYGPVTLTTAYAKSLNMVAIQLANEVGGQAVIDTAHKLGVGKRLENFRSLGLGAQGMTVMEMVTGYGAMAAKGYPIEPHGIERVRRANGQVLWARRPSKPPVQVIEDRTIRMMNFLGTTVVRAGTGTNARIEGRMIAGKTGTSNDYRDAWFIGYVPGMVAGVWLGNDDNTSMNKVTGGLLATEVWKNLMVVALRDTPIQELPLPAPEDYPLTTLPAPMEAIPELPPITALGPQPAPAAAKPPTAPAAPARGGDG
jgi:penicillin-binding protein 1A